MRPSTDLRRLAAGACALAALAAFPGGARAATPIDGGEVGGQVWTTAGSPYQVSGVNGDLTVAAGTELRIEAGTVVQFSNGWGSVLLSVTGTLTIAGTAASPVVLGDAFDGNMGWRGITTVGDAAAVRITGAVIRNAVEAVVVTRTGADVQIARSTFENDLTGITTRGTHTFDALVLRNNRTGIEVDSDTLTVTNALVVGNTISGILLEGGSLLAVNCTFDANAVAIASEAVTAGGAAASVANSIFSNTTMGTIHQDGGPVVNVTSSTFWNNSANVLHLGTIVTPGTTAPAGSGNVVANPSYVSPTDLHLAPGSPCIDSAVATGAPDHDLESTPRPQGAGFDRGAYERASFGSAGSGGTGGSAGSGGAGGPAGSGGAGGPAGSGGAGGPAGSGGAGGAAGSPGGRGGSAGATAGAGGSGGVTGSAGVSGSAGVTGSGGAGGSAGVAGSAGVSGSAGVTGSASVSGGAGSTGGGRGGGAGTSTAGTTGSAGAGGAAAGASQAHAGGGCGCGVGTTGDGGAATMLAGALAMLLVRRCARGRRQARAAARRASRAR